MDNPQQITLGQVLEMAPGENGEKVYINDEFEAIVTDPKERTSKKGSKFWVCNLVDPHNPSIKLETSFFRNPASYVGKVCYFSGSGMTREQYGQTAKVGLGRDTKIQVMGKAPGSELPQQRSSTPPAQENHRPPTQLPPATQNASFSGQAVIQALAILRADGGTDFFSPEFPKALHTVASDILRVHGWLEAGKLAPADGGPPSHDIPPVDAPKGGNRPPIDDDVPF